MKRALLWQDYGKTLRFMAVFFIGLSIIIHLFDNFMLYRLLRGAICYCVLFYLMAYQGKNLSRWIIGFLFFYGASSVTTVWYENSLMASLSMALNFVAILILIGFVLPKLSLKRMNKTFTLLFVIIIIINGYLLLQLVALFKGMTLSNTHYMFMLLSAMSVVFLAFLALAYNHFYNSKVSFVFAIFVFLIIFAEIFRGIGYYNLTISTFFVYLARIFLIFGLAVLAHFSFLLSAQQKELNVDKT